MATTGTCNYQWSQAMIGGFVSAGVTHAVLSPGSRSTPLALAMLRQPGLHCEVAVDERSAAFFALGMANASRRPVLLLATSGTAPAHWLPAVIEASQAAIPLILLSADRPPELHGCGANQTIEQINLFGSHVRASHALGAPEPDFDPAYLHRLAARVVAQATWPNPGPVHLNQPFREPLIPAPNLPPPSPLDRIHLSYPASTPSGAAIAEVNRVISGQPGIIICGQQPFCPQFAAAVTQLAGQLNSPLLAEPLSNLRFGPHAHTSICVGYHRYLATPEFIAQHRPAWVLRFGAYPVTRHLQGLLSTFDGPQILVDPLPRWPDPAHRLTHLLHADPSAVCRALVASGLGSAAPGWLETFKAMEPSTSIDPVASHIPMLLAELPEDSALFIGNSLAIRQLDNHSGSAAKRLYFYANRGASGIDGNIASALGIAAIHGRVVALIGDLTCQHDLGSLVLAQHRDVVIVVINNAGGGIFDLLPQAGLPEFERGWRTPQQLNFADAARAFGLNHAAATTTASLQSALRHALRQGGPHLLELRVN